MSKRNDLAPLFEKRSVRRERKIETTEDMARVLTIEGLRVEREQLLRQVDHIQLRLNQIQPEIGTELKALDLPNDREVHWDRASMTYSWVHDRDGEEEK